MLFAITRNPFPRFTILKVFRVHLNRPLVPRLCELPIGGN